MSCKYNYTLEERPQRCLECKEPMCGSRIPKGYEFVQRVPAMVMTYKDDKGWVAYIFGPNCDMEIEEFKLRYIHELQHIMRCVGIKKEITL